MSDPKMVSERDAVERERNAYVRGWCDHGGFSDRGHGNASRLYPLPKVERPRVVQDPHEQFPEHSWKIEEGHVYWRCNGSRWRLADFGDLVQNTDDPELITTLTPMRLRALADLLANPTELVEEA